MRTVKKADTDATIIVLMYQFAYGWSGLLNRVWKLDRVGEVGMIELLLMDGSSVKAALMTQRTGKTAAAMAIHATRWRQPRTRNQPPNERRRALGSGGTGAVTALI